MALKFLINDFICPQITGILFIKKEHSRNLVKNCYFFSKFPLLPDIKCLIHSSSASIDFLITVSKEVSLGIHTRVYQV